MRVIDKQSIQVLFSSMGFCSFVMTIVLGCSVVVAQVPSGVGSGQFDPLPSVALPNDFIDMTLHNFNPSEDERPDVIMVTDLENKLDFYYSGSLGELSLAGSYQIENIASYQEVVMIDFDFDGVSECILRSTAGELVLITTQQGSTGIEEILTFPGIGFVTGMHVADIDGDSRDDLLLLTQAGIASGGETWVLSSLNNSQLELSPLVFPNANAVDSGDLDGDGDMDLVFAGAQIRKFVNEGTGDFSLQEEFDLLAPVSVVSICEVLTDNPDGDVYLDIVAFLFNNPGCFILAGTSSGLHSAPVLAYEEELAQISEPLFAQLRGEGTSDLIFFDELDNEIHILKADGEDGNAFGSVREYDAPIGTTCLKITDFNLDGVLDLAAMSASEQVIQVYLGIIRDADFERGDVNRDGNINIADPVMGLTVLFTGQGVIPCMDSLDCDDNGELDLADPIMLLSALFSGGANLPEPYGECASDSTDDSLDCASLNALDCP